MDNGAHFYRCDFQVHSPRDRRWDGAGAVTDDERRAYAKEFVDVCREKGITAVAITDHHDICLFHHIKRAAAEETNSDGKPLVGRDRLVVFPGMELTLGVPCQAIIIFDAEFPAEFLEQAAQALSITIAPATDPRTIQTERLGHLTSLARMHETLDERPFLRGRYIILPNVSEGGSSTLLRSGFAHRYKEMPCVGGYLDGAVTQHGQGNQEIVSGKNKEYGNKAIGLFQTSDNRSRTFADLGKHTTWVKWATPTAEALRQACLARESRLSHTEPQKPASAITMLNVSNSQFLGPITLEFNPQYNAIIGGRGTGKSTILEYLRWALCDQPPTNNEDVTDLHAKRRELIEATLLPGTTVDVAFLLNDIPHVVRRKTGTDELLLKIGAAEFTPCTAADVRSLLPIQAYSQKQLSGVGVRLDELVRFIQAPIDREREKLKATRGGLRASLRAAYGALRQHRAASTDLARLHLERTSLSSQLDQLRKSIKGLDPKDQELVAAQVSHEAERQLVDTWTQELVDTRETIAAARTSLDNYPSPLPTTPTPQRDHLSTMREELSATFQTLRVTLDALKENLDANSSTYQLASYESALTKWTRQARKNEQDYAAAMKRSAAHETTLTAIKQVEGRLRNLDDTIVTQQRTLASLGEPATRLATLRREWDEAQRAEANLIESECRNLTTLSKGYIRARLVRGGRVDRIDERLRAALKGTKIRAERYDAIWDRVREAKDPYAEWSTMLDELEILSAPPNPTEATQPPTPVLESTGLSLRDRQAIARTLTPDAWLDLLTEGLDDLPEFEYRTRELEYIKFRDASAGQQATALLLALLNQTGPPLLIDQPEDDLDNKVMDEIVREIWNAKTRRQLIFSSHNANLVVNGDAELVVCCDYRIAGDQSGGKIKLEGAIDVPMVNEEIAEVMEGGREAFVRRQAKYGF